MMKRDPVIIYDTNARNGLRHYGFKPASGNYRVFATEWFKFYDLPRTKRRLDDALRRLPNSSRRRRMRLSRSGVSKLVRQEWFRMRVVDMYLFFAAERK